jgi:radical SAM-linked protein
VDSATPPAGGPVQRWRIRYAVEASAAGRSQRDEAEAWAWSLEDAALPLVRAGSRAAAHAAGVDGSRPRPSVRIAFGPPLPADSEATDEPLEISLSERRTMADVRAELGRCAPPGHRVVEVHDVWIRAPALSALVRELEYRIEVEGTDGAELRPAVAAIVAAESLPRERSRGQRTRTIDLRPLIADLRLEGPDATDRAGGVDGREEGTSGRRRAAVLLFRARVDPERGVGRPDDVLGALGDRLGRTLEVTRIIRTRVRLADDVVATPGDDPSAR